MAQSILKTALQLTFIGPRIAWRVMEMMAAATQVIPARTEMFVAAVKTPNRAAANETMTMVSEKFIGSWESMSAAAASAIAGTPESMRFGISARGLLDAAHKLVRSPTLSTWIVNQGALQIKLMKAMLGLWSQALLLGLRLFMRTSEPLHKRVTANARRLNRPRRTQR